MDANDVKVFLATGLNVSASGFQIFLTKLEPFLQVILIIVNIAISVVTLLYAIRKYKSKK